MPILLPPDELDAWLRLSLEPGLGRAQARLLLAQAGMPQHIYSLSTGQLAKWLDAAQAARLKAPLPESLQHTLEATRGWLDHPDHHLLTLADPGYPAALLQTPDPPLLLYLKGNPALLGRPAIGVVGSRSATAGGIDNALAFSRYLAEHQYTVISGLALGIDAAAHEGALQAGPQGGGTVAVMATGIDLVFPARHRQLAHRIAAHGAVVSEYPLGTHALPYHFPQRNRLVAALSQGVLVVEAAVRSGSLITARLATEMGREVFAIPGSIHSPMARGCHALIKQGAKLVESGQDILDELGQGKLPLPGRHAAATDSPRARAVRRAEPRDRPLRTPQASHHASLQADAPEARVLDALGYDPASIEQLVERTGLSVGALNAWLMTLELQGAVERLEDGRFQQRPADAG